MLRKGANGLLYLRLAGKVFVDQFGVIDISRAADESAQRSGLPKERIELPELLLLPIVEWMIVALSALHLQAQKDSGCLCRRLRCLVVQLVGQKLGEGCLHTVEYGIVVRQ